MILTVDILQTVAAALTYTANVSGIVSAGTDSDGKESFTVSVDRTYHQVAGPNVTLDSKDYKITAISNNTSITIKENTAGDGAPNIDTFTVAAPYYRHGTVIDVNNELVNITDGRDKFPALYVYEPFSEDMPSDPGSTIGRNSSLRLFLLAECRPNVWETDDHYSNVIQPMNNLCDELIEYFNTPGNGFGRVATSNRTNHVNLSVTRTLKGQGAKIFDDWLSGVEMSLNLIIKNNCLNLECCN